MKEIEVGDDSEYSGDTSHKAPCAVGDAGSFGCCDVTGVCCMSHINTSGDPKGAKGSIGHLESYLILIHYPRGLERSGI